MLAGSAEAWLSLNDEGEFHTHASQDYKLFTKPCTLYYSKDQLTAIMSYFQKYQRTSANLRPNSTRIEPHSTDTPYEAHSQSSTDSRQSYLKAFKKYYIDKLISQKAAKNLQENQPHNKDNFCFHETPLKERHNTSNLPTPPNNPNKSWKEPENSKSSLIRDTMEQQEYPKMNRSKIVALVNHNDNQLEQLLYSSISQVEREMMKASDHSDLARENSLLRGSIEKLKLVLKERLQVALKRNKEQLTLMFDEYSNMIKKLLEDKEKLTSQLEKSRQRLFDEEESKRTMQREYENKIRIIVEENNAQVSCTKQQIEQFLDMIIQFEEEANIEKEELQRLRERVVELEIENDKLKKEVNSFSESDSFSKSYSAPFQRSRPNSQVDRYVQKIENLLDMVDKLQQENLQLNQFLKLCKCSKIKKKSEELQSEENSVEDKKAFERRLIQCQKEFIREEMLLREAIRRKDQCIDRLNLLIEEMRKERYESVDRLTQQAIGKQPIK